MRALLLVILMGVCFGWQELRQRWSGEPTAVPLELPVQGMVAMIDLGFKKCIPCQMMEPILKALGKEYQGMAACLSGRRSWC